MNIKNVLVQVAVTYIAMIGASSAAPPIIEPVAVETVEGNPLDVEIVGSNPLEVAVVNPASPEVRIPYQRTLECIINVGGGGGQSCNIEFLTEQDYPAGTNMFVFQSISTHQFVRNDLGVGQTVSLAELFTHIDGQHFRLVTAETEPFREGVQFFRETHHEYRNVTLYNDTSRRSEVVFSLLATLPENDPIEYPQRLAFAGYFTWVTP